MKLRIQHAYHDVKAEDLCVTSESFNLHAWITVSHPKATTIIHFASKADFLAFAHQVRQEAMKLADEREEKAKDNRSEVEF